MAHVLVVDDEVLPVLALKSHLSQHGHRVSTAFTGLEAVCNFDLDPADLVITDYRMPRMNGAELVRLLRGRRPALPVLVLTGCAAEMEDRAGMEKSGPLIVLDKPVDMQQIDQAIALLFPAS